MTCKSRPRHLTDSLGMALGQSNTWNKGSKYYVTIGENNNDNNNNDNNNNNDDNNNDDNNIDNNNNNDTNYY